MTDPVHDGHWDHIKKAYALGNWLYIITHPDSTLAKKKGLHFVSLETRMAVLEGLLLRLGGKGVVIVAVDEDGTVAKTLEILKPTVFAKGGDRTAGTMPQSELEVCEKIGCEVRYGVGDLLNSSSRIMKDWVKANDSQ